MIHHKAGETPDVIKGLQRGFALLIQNLHQPVGVDEHGVGFLLRQAQDLAHGVGECDVKHGAVQQAAGDFVIEDVNFANAGNLLDQALDFARILDQ